MTIFNVIKENVFTGEISFKTCASEAEAKETMRKSWEKDVQKYRDKTGRDLPEEECRCGERTAMLTMRETEPSSAGVMRIENVLSWRIKESEIDVQVAVRVKNGLVEEIYSNANPDVKVYDLDSSEFPEEGEEAECDRKEKELEKLIREPGWQQVW